MTTEERLKKPVTWGMDINLGAESQTKNGLWDDAFEGFLATNG